ncbi:o-succinylbenzoate synthase [Bacillus sp. HMF5848]|uniref:o-succinylbenzoate synthase n=1 Tax=Bacillus sp. HMF5848 TaxID=2495421 RepID=UPI000F7A8233|nr:o-succinylbenzoate synthase [Bacillus sp. HMF5848]RSK27637.1 o-succinylbenzoate synthase [Bacillus sp. HMF5848]
MNIKRIDMYRLKMPLKDVFETSMGVETHREFILLSAYDGDEIGFGECVAMDIPVYSEETVDTCWHMLEQYMIPAVLNRDINHPDEFHEQFRWIRGNKMAKATLEGAIWDLYCKIKDVSLAKELGGVKKEILSGISMGIEKNIDKLLHDIEGYVAAGYKRLKLKIKPGYDIEPIRAIRERFPTVPLMADANSAYTLDDIDLLKEMDQFNLMMIEQPLPYDDIIDHATLQREINTPICLDESIKSTDDARKAIELGSCKIINIKVGRVGGLSESKRLHDICEERGIPVWCGGMQESGIGRAHNIAISSLSNFTIPGDTSPSSRYWIKDITTEEVEFHDPGKIAVPDKPGIGYGLCQDTVSDYLIRREVYVK